MITSISWPTLWCHLADTAEMMKLQLIIGYVLFIPFSLFCSDCPLYSMIYHSNFIDCLILHFLLRLHFNYHHHSFHSHSFILPVHLFGEESFYDSFIPFDYILMGCSDHSTGDYSHCSIVLYSLIIHSDDDSIPDLIIWLFWLHCVSIGDWGHYAIPFDSIHFYHWGYSSDLFYSIDTILFHWSFDCPFYDSMIDHSYLLIHSFIRPYDIFIDGTLIQIIPFHSFSIHYDDDDDSTIRYHSFDSVLVFSNYSDVPVVFCWPIRPCSFIWWFYLFHSHSIHILGDWYRLFYLISCHFYTNCPDYWGGCSTYHSIMMMIYSMCSDIHLMMMIPFWWFIPLFIHSVCWGSWLFRKCPTLWEALPLAGGYCLFIYYSVEIKCISWWLSVFPFYSIPILFILIHYTILRDRVDTTIHSILWFLFLYWYMMPMIPFHSMMMIHDPFDSMMLFYDYIRPRWYHYFVFILRPLIVHHDYSDIRRLRYFVPVYSRRRAIYSAIPIRYCVIPTYRYFCSFCISYILQWPFDDHWPIQHHWSYSFIRCHSIWRNYDYSVRRPFH